MKLDKDWLLGFEIGFWILVTFLYVVEMIMWPASTVMVTLGVACFYFIKMGSDDWDQNHKRKF